MSSRQKKKQEKQEQLLMTVAVIEKARMDLYRLWEVKLFEDGSYIKTMLNEDTPAIIKAKYLLNLNAQAFSDDKK